MKTEVRNEFILEAHKHACSEWKLKIENECPELFKSNLEVGKWYKWIDGNDILLWNVTEIKNQTIYSYGFYNEDWIDNKIAYSKKYYQEACDKLKPVTEEEVEEALIKEAKKLGFKKGANIKGLSCFDGLLSGKNCLGDGVYHYCFLNNILYANISEEQNCVLFDNGKWATIISNPIEEKINDLQKQIDELKKQL